MAYVEFAPGHSDISAAAEAKLRSLAKALADRPALKLDATGRAVPDVDREGLKRAALERAMRVQKQKSLRAEESAPSAEDTMTIDVAEYPVLLKAVYRDTKLADKPRNILGMEKDIPPAEMEGLLLASYGADDGALRDLANRRAEAAPIPEVAPVIRMVLVMSRSADLRAPVARPPASIQPFALHPKESRKR